MAIPVILLNLVVWAAVHSAVSLGKLACFPSLLVKPLPEKVSLATIWHVFFCFSMKSGENSVKQSWCPCRKYPVWTGFFGRMLN